MRTSKELLTSATLGFCTASASGVIKRLPISHPYNTYMYFLLPTWFYFERFWANVKFNVIFFKGTTKCNLEMCCVQPQLAKVVWYNAFRFDTSTTHIACLPSLVLYEHLWWKRKLFVTFFTKTTDDRHFMFCVQPMVFFTWLINLTTVLHQFSVYQLD